MSGSRTLLGASFFVLLAAPCACSSSAPPGSSSSDVADSGAPVDGPRPDAGQVVYSNDGAVPVADSASPIAVADSGPLGSVGNPANSCAEIHFELPNAPNGIYQINELGEAPTGLYCDMTTGGGGWTKVTKDFQDEFVVLAMGDTGRIMLKCADDGSSAIVSPVITSATWHWASTSSALAPGEWTVNGATVTCGANPEYSGASCTALWGYGCDQGAGSAKLIPGVSGAASSATCTDTTSAHTSGAFSICGSDDYAHYSVFVRAGA